jgi:hypothetical protein
MLKHFTEKNLRRQIIRALKKNLKDSELCELTLAGESHAEVLPDD